MVAQSARAGEPDRHLSALLAPPAVRPHLLALAAFASELSHVSTAVTREPAMGEIRLQWWRDALVSSPDNVRTGHPVADAMRAAVRDCRLPHALVLDVIDAHELELAAHPVADDAELASYLWKSQGALFALAAGMLGAQSAETAHAAASTGGHAYGLARLLLGFPHALARGRVALPRSRLVAAGVALDELSSGSVDGGRITGILADLGAEARKRLAAARQHVANLPRGLRVAFLPLALVETYLQALERPGRDVLHVAAEIAPVRRVVRIAAAHWLGRI